MNESEEKKGSKRNGSMSILSYFCKKSKINECVESDNNSCSTISNKVSSACSDYSVYFLFSELMLLFCSSLFKLS